MKFLGPILVWGLLSTNAFGTVKNVCVINSDIDSNYGVIYAEVDDTTNEIKGLYQDTFEDSKLINHIEIKQENLKDGVVLDSDGDRITVLLQSSNFDFHSGGELVLDTLYSGVTGKRKQYLLNAAISNGSFSLESDQQNFSKMFFVANRSVLFGVIGIDHILFQN